tara:strand:- start:490 stop:792 length:303 start_codon:yes stop_codon:yes gene_type:complete
MKYIKQKSTNKIIFREEPFSDKTLDNAVIASGIAKADLEVVEVDWDDATWNNNSVSYEDKRIKAYGSIGDQLDMQYRDLKDGTTVWKDHIAKVKTDIPKN